MLAIHLSPLFRQYSQCILIILLTIQEYQNQDTCQMMTNHTKKKELVSVIEMKE